MKRKILLFTILALATRTLAQTPRTGLLTSDDRYRTIPLLPAYSGVKYNETPAKVSLKKYCPVPGDQRRSGACVGWAIGYGAMTIQRAILSNTTDQALITQHANSAAFLFNQVSRSKTDCAEGAYLEDALTLLKEQGDCLERSFNSEENDCRVRPSETQYTEALQYKAQDYAAVFELDENPKNKIGKACKVLATQTPLVVAIGVTKGFFELLPGSAIWNPTETEATVGYHAMVLVGYNSVEKYFELLNSFGASWGQNGFIRIAFDDFERLCRYAYVIMPNESASLAFQTIHTVSSGQATSDALPEEQHFLSGEFVFRRPAGFVANASGEELMYFEEIQTRRETIAQGVYSTVQPSFNTGDVFQLAAREIPRGRYAYVFSRGPDGVLNLHFPRAKDAVASAGFMLEKTVEIIIPGEDRLLQLSMPGEDYLCILYSYAPIPNFEQRLRKIETLHTDFVSAVQRVFADVLIPPLNVQLSADKMSFSAIATPSSGQIAASIILKVISN